MLELVIIIVMNVSNKVAVVSAMIKRLKIRMLFEKQLLFRLFQPITFSFDLFG